MEAANTDQVFETNEDIHYVAGSIKLRTCSVFLPCWLPVGLHSEMTWNEGDPGAGMELDDIDHSCHTNAHSAGQHLASTAKGRPKIAELVPNSWKVALGLFVAVPLALYVGSTQFCITDHHIPT